MTCNGIALTNNGIALTDNGIASTNNGIALTDNGIVSTDNGIASTDNGIASTNNGIASTDNGIALTDNGIVSTNNGIASTDIMSARLLIKPEEPHPAKAMLCLPSRRAGRGWGWGAMTVEITLFCQSGRIQSPKRLQGFNFHVLSINFSFC
ncbi:MAG: hypothetical protein ACYTXF_24655 [Nostoc sp.]